MRVFAAKVRTKKEVIHRRVVVVALGIGVLPWIYDVVPVEASDALLDCKKVETREPDSNVLMKGVGPFRFATGPEFSKVAESWDLVVHGVIARYTALCNRIDAGLAIKAQYETELKEIDKYYREAKELETKLSDSTLSHRNGAHATATGLESAVADLASRLRKTQAHEQMSAPLKPGQPKKPRPILGAPGREEESEPLLVR